MNKVIGGKRYDTATAKEMGFTSHNYPRDFSYWEETLYRKSTGEYFLYGAGNAASKYAESCGQNEWCGGEKIIPLDIGAAQKWAEKYLDADEYEKIFGKIEEDKKTVTYSLPGDVVEKIKREASASGISMSEWISRLVENA